MKTETKRMVAVIDERTAADFEQAFNAKMEELTEFDVEFRYGITKDFLCYIYYSYEVKTPESAKEEFIMNGDVYHCEDCPMIQWNPDKRSNRHSCPRSKMVHDNTPACTYFYEALKEGRIEVER